MIKLHHLNQSRSKRIIWLLEELDVNYEIVPYVRDSVTFMAPPELKSVHPLGKSPVLEDNGEIIIESGAMTEYLIEKYSDGAFAPERGTKAHTEYLQWMHFAESSAILPMLLKIFVSKEPNETQFLSGYADKEAMNVLGYFEQSLEGKTYLVEERLTGADIMMSFIVELVQKFGLVNHFPNIERYGKQLATHPACAKAEQLEVKYS
ncbi:glutathione S-transferase [Vibrio alginolyticus]|uniref:glutathione S-transferase family protein n=1 Tax=Vibrio TaxID=662 RepID=UPI0006A5DB5E|nr:MULTISPECIES: glutathione S-transferase [Vibrio]EGQ9231977.1 glutathione S-transferase [Vibrio alginolyticus]EGR0712350.1 glutathione S-transferase [Vibrio alginolyticus]ELA6792560.1 glutathione S-transferase [Vibrio alginolyticus]ELA8376013.1 glutathione S-transferase [Vibrio alginolyticus]ELB2815450.1 glutathione S-transferase [Vibrio alginolyticus]